MLREVSIPEGFYGWEPYHLDASEDLIATAALHARGKKFLDAGCGIGTKCLLATYYGFEPFGIEWIPEYAAQAGNFGVRVFQEDMREFTRWQDFDVIYLNHPFTTREREQAFESRMQEQISPGSILIKVWDYLGTPPGNWEVLMDVHEEGNRNHGAWMKVS